MDPNDPDKCCFQDPINTGQCLCNMPQIDDPNNPGTCCDEDPNNVGLCQEAGIQMSRLKEA